MQQFTDVNYNISEQHKGTLKSRQMKDMEDIKKITIFFKDNSPCMESQYLYDIKSKECISNSVNVYDAYSIGIKILNDMKNTWSWDYTFRKKSQTIMLKSKQAIMLKKTT